MKTYICIATLLSEAGSKNFVGAVPIPIRFYPDADGAVHRQHGFGIWILDFFGIPDVRSAFLTAVVLLTKAVDVGRWRLEFGVSSPADGHPPAFSHRRSPVRKCTNLQPSPPIHNPLKVEANERREELNGRK